MVRAALAALIPSLFVALPAVAETDTFGIGTGADGALTVTSPTILNDYVELVADSTGSVLMTSDSSGKFAAGDLVMVYVATGEAPVPTTLPALQMPIDLQGSATGRFEFARVASATATSITLTQPLLAPVTAHVTQVVRVPEFTTVSISGGGAIGPQPWDGHVGGVVVFLANDTVTVSGAGIDTSSKGYRGGVAKTGQMSNMTSMSLDADPSANIENAAKGEGIGLDVYGAAFVGRGNRFGGGGGGNSARSGGGGGSNAGKGGGGGNASSGAVVGGLAGVAQTYDPSARLIFGGGGGAGHGTTVLPSSGANGGGAVLVRAKKIVLQGPVRANGGSVIGVGVAAGGGGGGAGGTIALRSSTSIDCMAGAVIQTRGGNGGNVATTEGPGGGGSGGRIFVQAATIGATCKPDEDGAYSGTNIGGQTNGGGTGFPGAPQVVNGGFCGTDADCGGGALCDFDSSTCSSDPDIDGDGIANASDNCVHVANADQTDSDGDGAGDACDPAVQPADSDNDTVPDTIDNCPSVANPDQADMDADGIGDVCDSPATTGCALDAECGDPASGMICVDQSCVAGCRGKNGNACPDEQICSSADAKPGTCSPIDSMTSSGTGVFEDPNGIFVSGNGVACSTSPGSSGGLLGAIGVAIGALALWRKRRSR
jgi:hypothetical protein